MEFSDWLHLTASSLWAGALIAISIVFRPSLVAQDNWQQPIVAGIADKFYVLFGPVLSLLVFSGLYNAWTEVGSFGLLVTTPYGRALSAKIVLLLLLAFRYIAPPQHGQDESAFAIKFLHRTRLEAIMISTVLLCAAVLTHNIPARHFMHLEHAMTMTMGSHMGHEEGQHEHYATRPEPVIYLETSPADAKAGTPVKMTVHIEGQNGQPLEGLTVHHERILHAIVIGSDLKVFAHIHPEDIGPVTDEMLRKATFPLRFTFPKAGEYLVGLDFATADGLYSKPAHIKVSGRPTMVEAKPDFSTEKDFGAYHVALKISPANIKAGEETTLRYHIEKNKKPVADLSPYLGAPMHLAIVSEDLKQFIHAHGVIPGESHTHMDHMHMHAEPGDKFGPEIESVVVFPAKGVYKIFSQVNHQGTVLLFDFMVKVQ
jgi:uncharacterized membrane protein